MIQLRDNGLIHLSSPHTVMETFARLETIVQAKGLTILARIDHSGDAADETAHFWQCEIGNAIDGRFAQRRYRPATKGIGLAG